jgi:transcriptional regulator with XRE-family HTH domain
MPRGIFDAARFYAVLDDHRVSRNFTWKQVAEESGVPASTLTRMAQGKRPDVDSLAALLHWSGESADSFMKVADASNQPTSNALVNVAAQFRADPNLSPEAKKTIEAALKALYSHFTENSQS